MWVPPKLLICTLDTLVYSVCVFMESLGKKYCFVFKRESSSLSDVFLSQSVEFFTRGFLETWSKKYLTESEILGRQTWEHVQRKIRQGEQVRWTTSQQFLSLLEKSPGLPCREVSELINPNWAHSESWLASLNHLCTVQYPTSLRVRCSPKLCRMQGL